MLKSNDQIGPYTLIRQLGHGGFGVVWLAERRSKFATTQVAVKIAIDTEPDLDEIAQESRLWAQISAHPNILPIIEADMYDGYVLIVSEYAPDGSLEHWIKRRSGTQIPLEMIIKMISGILSGLTHLHNSKIIHRDLKPANILLTHEVPRLADFGLARLLRSSGRTGNIAGTPAYMSPEAFDGERSEQTDIWSVGVILYQLLTGTMPFPQIEWGKLLRAIIANEPTPLPETIPPTIHAIVNCALNKKLEERYKTALEMYAALQTALACEISPLALKTTTYQVFNPALTMITPHTLTKIEEPFKKTAKISEHVCEYSAILLNERAELEKRYIRQAHYYIEGIDNVNFEMIAIPGGTFLLGSSENELERNFDESPQQEISIPSFYLSKYAVTQAQWQAVSALPVIKHKLNSTPSYFTGENLPVEQVSWEEAVEFCARLAAKTGKSYQLPSETQWEYACRGNIIAPFSFGATITPDIVNYNGNNSYAKVLPGVFRRRTIEVGSLQIANPFGIYDMHGNIWEWCQDIYHSSYKNCPTDGSAWEDLADMPITWRVVRGGAWNSPAKQCRAAARHKLLPDIRSHHVGFRIICLIS